MNRTVLIMRDLLSSIVFSKVRPIRLGPAVGFVPTEKGMDETEIAPRELAIQQTEPARIMKERQSQCQYLIMLSIKHLN